MSTEPWTAVGAIGQWIETAIAFLEFLVVAVGIAFAVYQLREMKKDRTAQIFLGIVSLLQEPKCREARRSLIQLDERDFTKWSDEQKSHAEHACNTYDVVAILLQREVIDPTMITAEWRNSIIRCWNNAQPMISAYRRERGQDYWDDFDWLYEEAKKLGRDV